MCAIKPTLIFIIILVLSVNLSSQSYNEHSSPDYSVYFPSPADVHLNPGGRFDKRFKGNIDYLNYQLEYFGEMMVESFSTRHYSPGKLLERMWDGEYAGKWLDAATRSAVSAGDKELLIKVDAFADSLIARQGSDGYMGIQFPTDRELNVWERTWDLWNQWNCMIGFLTHYELRGNEGSLDASRKIGKWIVGKFTPISENAEWLFEENITGGFTNAVLIGQMMRLYRHTGDEDFLNFTREVIEEFPPSQEMLSTGEPYLFHPYMLSAVIMGMAEYAVATKDEDMLSKIEQAWNGLEHTHMYPTGSLGERENLDDQPIKDVVDGQLQETCATTEWIFLTMSLYEITGKVKYINALEKTFYNALIGAQSDDGMKWCYWMPLRYSKHFLHGPTRCCYWSGPRGIARIPQVIYAVQDEKLYVNLYESSSATLKVNEGEINIEQNSGFPLAGSSSIVINTPTGWKGTANLRVPDWTENFIVKNNGVDVSGSELDEGYLKLKLQGSDQYSVEIQFDVKFGLEELAGNYVMIRGPEVLAIDMRDNIDTWLGGHDDLITLPPDINLLPLVEGKRYQWPGPAKTERRRYIVRVNDARTAELREVVITPYADAGNEGAAFRTAFPRDAESNYPGDWQEE